jgi:hypothetical protein
MEQFRHSLIFRLEYGKPQAYRKGAAEPYQKTFCAKPRQVVDGPLREFRVQVLPSSF